jgi:hypothetical protein
MASNKKYDYVLTEVAEADIDDIRRILVGNFIAYYVIDDAKKQIVVLRVVSAREIRVKF